MNCVKCNNPMSWHGLNGECPVAQMFEIGDSTISWDRNNGWICPRCGRVYSPSMVECLNCNKIVKNMATDKEESEG